MVVEHVKTCLENSCRYLGLVTGNGDQRPVIGAEGQRLEDRSHSPQNANRSRACWRAIGSLWWRVPSKVGAAWVVASMPPSDRRAAASIGTVAWRGMLCLRR